MIFIGDGYLASQLNTEPRDVHSKDLPYDAILDRRFSGDALDWWRYADTSLLQQSISWNVFAVPEPGSWLVLGWGAAICAIVRRRRDH